MERRAFLGAGLGAVAMVAAVDGLTARAALAQAPPARISPELGPLRDTADLTDGAVRLALPAGWVYRSVSGTGEKMTDGNVAPGRPDGMGAFWGPGGTIRVVRNHEERESAASGVRPFPGPKNKAYDSNVIGGTTTLDVDPKTRALLGDWVSMNGTTFNCAGGPTPWGTWISAEESVNGPDVGADFAGNGPDFKRKHGYLYEVDPSRGPGDLTEAKPIRSAGRFAHEACAIDPRTGILYQTEDQFLSAAGFYRYVTGENPMTTRKLADGGELLMLRVKGARRPTVLGGVLEVGSTFKVDWVTIDDPDPQFRDDVSNNEAIANVARQGFAKNAAKFARPEGCWYGNGYVWFSCTTGGATELNEEQNGQYGNGYGQIWRFDPMAEEPDVLDLPDNLTVSPTGNVVICEDGTDGNYVRALSPDGELSDVAINRTDRPDEEFAGICFSPDGRTMFVNIQAAIGRTYIIWREDNEVLL